MSTSFSHIYWYSKQVGSSSLVSADC